MADELGSSLRHADGALLHVPRRGGCGAAGPAFAAVVSSRSGHRDGARHLLSAGAGYSARHARSWFLPTGARSPGPRLPEGHHAESVLMPGWAEASPRDDIEALDGRGDEQHLGVGAVSA